MDDEKYSDPLDVASRNEMYATNESVRVQRLNSIPQQFPDDKGNFLIRECVCCGEDIGEQRLRVAIKNLLCWECATAQERKAKK